MWWFARRTNCVFLILRSVSDILYACSSRNYSIFISGEFDNTTYKGCTLDENYCDQHTPPCYTCDWDLCNPKDHKSFNGRSPGIATKNGGWKFVAGIISIAMISESRNSGE